MTRGRRQGQLVRADFLERLTANLVDQHHELAGQDKLVRTVLAELNSRDQLYGFARYHKLLADAEVAESCPKVHHTVPCYLYTHVRDPAVREAIETYVLAYSQLYERGAALLNGLAAAATAAAFETKTTSFVDLWSHVQDPAVTGIDQALVNVLSDENDLKQFFLPERWPEKEGVEKKTKEDEDDNAGDDSESDEDVEDDEERDDGKAANNSKRPKCRARNALVAQALREHGPKTQHLFPSNWKSIMSVSGWDNALNSMGKKYRVALQNMVTENIVPTLWKYFSRVFTRRHAFEYPENDVLETLLSVLHGAFHGRLRPLVVHQDDFALLVALRAEVEGRHGAKAQAPDVSKYLATRAKYTPQLLAVHLFAKRVTGADGLPVVARARHYAYMDAKILAKLLGPKKSSKKKAPQKKKSSGSVKIAAATMAVPPPTPPIKPLTVCGYLQVGDFNATRRSIRASCRRRYRRRYGGDQSARAKVLRYKALRQKWQRAGIGKLPHDAAIHSAETDGVGLRLGVQRPDHKADAACVRPVDVELLKDVVQRVAHCSTTLEDVVKEIKAQRRTAASEKAALAKKLRTSGEECASEPMQPLVDALGREPAFAGGDTGRAKPLTVAATPSACRAPKTLTLTRRRYYNAMRYHKRQRWENGRVQALQPVKTALAALSVAALQAKTGCDSLRGWQARMDAEAEHYQVLWQEYVVDKQRALWKMRMLRWKRACLDQEAARIIRTATDNDKTRNLVIGIGDGGFPCTGPGELPAPTSALTQALRRAKVRRDLQPGAGQTVLTSISEIRTTMCCCACGAITHAPAVRDPKTGLVRPSRRLRLCTSCDDTAGKLRDRDVQAARNILWLTIYKYYGLERPEYLCRVKKQVEEKKKKTAAPKRAKKPTTEQHSCTSQASAP